MFEISDLIHLVDCYKALEGIAADTTVSSRVFSDSKKIAALRAGSEITVGRFNDAVRWFYENCPEEHEKPALLQSFASSRSQQAA